MCIYKYISIHLCSNQISTLLPPPKRKRQVFAHISQENTRRSHGFYWYEVSNLQPKESYISYVRNCCRTNHKMTLNASWSAKTSWLPLFLCFWLDLRKTWFGVCKSKSNVHTMQVVDANCWSYMCTVPWNPILDKFCFCCDSFREWIHGPPDGSHFFTRGSCSCSSKRRLKIGFMSMWCFTVLKTESLGRKQRNKKPFSKFIFLSKIEQHLVGFTLNKKHKVFRSFTSYLW